MSHPRTVLFGWFVALWCLSAPVNAQPVGTFRWQMQPYCNVVTVNVAQQGGLYTLDGTDDRCGAAQSASAVGLAFLNPSGSVGFGLSIVLPGGTPIHVEATITMTSLNGTWRDSTGNSGAFIFTPGAGSGGAPRPVPAGGVAPASITSAAIAPNAVGTSPIAPGAVGSSQIAPGRSGPPRWPLTRSLERTSPMGVSRSRTWRTRRALRLHRADTTFRWMFCPRSYAPSHSLRRPRDISSRTQPASSGSSLPPSVRPLRAPSRRASQRISHLRSGFRKRFPPQWTMFPLPAHEHSLSLLVP
jgi:hypothetical protein